MPSKEKLVELRNSLHGYNLVLRKQYNSSFTQGESRVHRRILSLIEHAQTAQVQMKFLTSFEQAYTIFSLNDSPAARSIDLYRKHYAKFVKFITDSHNSTYERSSLFNSEMASLYILVPNDDTPFAEWEVLRIGEVVEAIDKAIVAQNKAKTKLKRASERSIAAFLGSLDKSQHALLLDALKAGKLCGQYSIFLSELQITSLKPKV